MKTLNIIATPIGNMRDVSENLKNTLQKVETFLSEDTRTTKKLLNILNVSLTGKKFIVLNSLTENELTRSFDFNSNQNLGLISDAGYPCISDPGYFFVNQAIKHDYRLNVINGPSSIMHAVVVSGLRANNFYFAGFLSKNKNEKTKQLENLSRIPTLIVFFESVHKIKETIGLIQNVFDNQNICIARELTKKHETIYRTTIKNLKKISIAEKGEFVILIENIMEQEKIDDQKLINEISLLVRQKYSLKEATKFVAYKYDKKSNSLYDRYLQYKKNKV